MKPKRISRMRPRSRPSRIARDVALASHEPIAPVGLTVEHATFGTCVTPRTLSVEHQGDVMDRPEQDQPDKPPGPPINGLPRQKILQQYPPPERAVQPWPTLTPKTRS